jgi:hypothetical protein
MLLAQAVGDHIRKMIRSMVVLVIHDNRRVGAPVSIGHPSILVRSKPCDFVGWMNEEVAGNVTGNLYEFFHDILVPWTLL